MPLLRTTFLLLFLLVTGSFAQKETGWTTLDKGLDYAELAAPVKSIYGDSKITVLRIDPKSYEFFLECATHPKNNYNSRPLDEWCKQKKFVAAINAGMFDGDDPTQPGHAFMCNRGYMKSFDHVNSSKVTGEKTVICFSPKDKSMPSFQIADIQNCETFANLKAKYNCLIQGIRMIDCKQQIRWQKDKKKWSVCVMGMDKAGNALFIHSRSPYTMYEFISMLQQLPLNLKTLIYLEGGPEASLYVSSGSKTVQRFGSYETGFNENDGNDHFWKLPNIVGIRKKP
ncbi:phosphodiester glycosidase family protein [Cytophagaceae bacterium DM2B3-1]|uniref:Phosphodiester glycosidase family protein n=1 Tax=Xanthocytophaga flava TaxID=3048013 RepID=A0ABT7CRY2_9BACT|nr:phosphodiester glycosidase family protein [Xanthocytophaga flavus]MDJ1496493.1 phosphodiester glycosidase family protein [Xanthocytophaga flavus]